VATFISLINFTDQGIRNVKDTVQRASNFTAAVERQGIKVQSLHWTVGQYDIVVTAEAPNAQAMTAALLGVGRLGNVRTNTLQAFDEQEMQQILGQMG
jgi:uncharacterized protein with GYD domain